MLGRRIVARGRERIVGLGDGERSEMMVEIFCNRGKIVRVQIRCLVRRDRAVCGGLQIQFQE